MKQLVFQALAEAARKREPVALGLISGVSGSSPQKVGAKALFHQDGRIQGTLGGGCLEAEIQQRALQSLRTGQAESFDLVLDHDFGWDDGLICGGKVQGVILPNAQLAGEPFWTKLAARQSTLRWGIKRDYSIALRESQASRSGTVDNTSDTGQASRPAGDWLYQETVNPPCALWIAGAGHIAQAVAPLALQLDFAVTVFDDRPALANPRFFPPAVSLEADFWERLLARPLPEGPSFGLIVTRGHRHDALVLREWIHKGFCFLGMIGSRRKARTILEQFTQEKIASPDVLRQVACPVGIDIRSQTVPEIAVSILAQFIDKRAELVYEKQALPAD
ncbi:MAG TPA: XdhC family protein [Bacillota bacterium]|nr:XdhC family protein [Bacillota bacterium]